MSKFWRGLAAVAVLFLGVAASEVAAQPLVKSAVSVDAGNTKLTGQTFSYRLTYNCSSTSGPCIGAQVVDLLPAEVQYQSTVPASPTGDVAAINVTPNFGGSGRTRVQFVMVSPLTAGNSGDLLINVRFPNGTTPNGTAAVNTADGINLQTTPGTFTTPPVTVTAVASLQATLAKTLTSTPANLDIPETYRLRVSVSNNAGSLNLTAIGPVVDTLPPGTVFNGATPAADCEPGCVGTTPATVTWTAPCTVPLAPGGNCDIAVNVTFPSATFPSGTNVTNSFTTPGTPLGQPPQSLGIGTITHPVTTFVPAPGVGFSKNMAGGTPNPPTLNQTFSYDMAPSNSGNVPVDNLVLIDTLPVQFNTLSVTTGAYNNLANFAAGEGVRVSYEKNTAPGVFTLWGSSPNTTTSTTLTAPPPGLGAGEYLTRIRWEFGQAAVGMAASTRPLITGRIINPANNGTPVAIGNAISNCTAYTAVYTAGPTNLAGNDCENFNVAGPFVQLNPAKTNLSGGGPFNPGQTVNWRLNVRSAPQSSDPVPVADLIATDLLPVDLNFASWTFDDQGTGLPAPQVFSQIPNFAGTGRTLLRWRWNAGSGNLGVNQQVFINIATSIRNGATNGNLSNDLTLEHDSPGLGQRCSGTSRADTLDYDGDGSTSETLCVSTGTITVAAIAQLISSKAGQSVCDTGFQTPPQGGNTLPGAELGYRLRVQNVGTVSMNNFVLVDILPFVGDTGVRDTSARGSQFDALLVAPIAPPPGTTLYYSTTGNPCRGEVGGPTTGCTPPNWSTSPPEPITATRAFKVEFGTRTIAPFDFVEFEFSMAAPANLPAGQTAFNSFAYQADRSDGTGSLAAEPLKIGATLGSCPVVAQLGDFVWVDTNRNGLQDDGQTGLNGITATLYTTGADGIPRNLDDVPVNTTITQNDIANNPGWYNFPNLDAGTYYVCFAPPPGYRATLRDQGGNDAQDSDVDPLSQCTAPVNLPAGTANLTLDYGVVPVAALGNYVWFDTNADGVQNEPVVNGANGVSVRLFADNGDGVCQGAPNDALVAATITNDDAFGTPGYYRFDELIPGTRYCVQFIRPGIATAFTTPNAGADDARDSDAALATGFAAPVILAAGEFNGTIDAGLINTTGTLSLGDQVWRETDNDGIFEPQNGETGIDNVELQLYRDINANGTPDAGEYLSRTATATNAGFVGRYRFDNLAAGNYIVVIDPANYAFDRALFGLTSSSGNDPAPDPDDDVNGDDNGAIIGAFTRSLPVTLTANGEPTSEDGNANTNLTVDFGFVPGANEAYDYGDAPDAGAGSGAFDYQTLAIDGGAFHRIDVANSPRLGDCVDGDQGDQQDANASADDGAGGTTFGNCATPGDDEDGVTFSALSASTALNMTIRAGAGVNACVVSGWIDWNGNGSFADAGEQVVSNVTVAAGGTSTQTVTAPATLPGTVYARFRCASVGGLAPTGAAADGEVEDYRLSATQFDYGDLPASYATQGAGAARHLIDATSAIYLGSCVDFEGDGQPNATANGDDNTAGSGRVGLCFDDEDGFVFANFAACTSTATTVTASAPGVLDAWFDFNNDGDLNDAGEHIVTDQNLVTGANTVTIATPCNATPGNTYARLRFAPNAAAVTTPGGDATGGEVEDYRVTVLGTDFGDAPATYPVTFAQDGARHVIDTSAATVLRLGACVDAEADGQTSAGATGDDTGAGSATSGTCVTANDDEDGVTFAPVIAVCRASTMTVNVTSGAAALIDAWIDFNRDGDWSDAGEQVATAVAANNGANAVTFNVPCNATLGATFARVRLSTAGSTTPTGAANDGEVEDHPLTLRGLDLGDLPDTAAGASTGNYSTLLADNGPSHPMLPTLFMGTTEDTELDGQPNAAAGAHDTTGTPDDEDGVTVADLALIAVTAPAVHVAATNTTGAPAILCGFIDYNADGDFNDAGETASTVVATGSNNQTFTLNFGVIPAVSATSTYARFRLMSDACAADGPAADGEVEDYAATITTFDLGDLPDTSAATGASDYQTLRANGGPRHVINAGLRIGATVDPEGDGQPTANADGDDTAGPAPDDEDGVTFPAAGFELGSPARVTVVATNQLATGALLCGYIDWNSDGDFTDTNEAAQLAVPAGSNTASFVLNFGLAPVTANTGLFGRFRLSTLNTCSPTGDAPDGEVEDYTLATTGNGALSVGNLVWEDRDNNGRVDTGEPGIDAVPVALYRDDDNNCTPDGASIATTTTAGGGAYLFNDLLPGRYLVEITAPAPYLGATGTGHYAPTGPYEPAPQPDNDIDNDDNGNGASGTIRSCGVQLLAKLEPTNDGDADNNTNFTVDFGLVFNFDLALRKTLSPGQAALVQPGATVNFTLTVFNQGAVAATNVLITDIIPAGMTLADTNWTAGAGNTATRTLAGPIAAGASATTTIALRITNFNQASFVNYAEITQAQDDVGTIRVDKDSTPDNIGTNDGPPVDDDIDNTNGDEDDGDIAVVGQITSIPVNAAWAMILMAMMVLMLGGRRLRLRR